MSLSKTVYKRIELSLGRMVYLTVADSDSLIKTACVTCFIKSTAQLLKETEELLIHLTTDDITEITHLLAIFLIKMMNMMYQVKIVTQIRMLLTSNLLWLIRHFLI